MPVQLSNEDVASLRAKGFTDNEIATAVNELNMEEHTGLQNSYDSLKKGNAVNPLTNASHSSFSVKASEDIARWQLELNDILEKAEHTLRGDVVVFENKQLIWKKNPTPENNTLNENGVQICMKFLSMYVNRNTILSDYTGEEIRYKVLDFGKRFNDLIFLKYDEMGMDNEEKRKEYAAIVGAMTDVVHSAYARAKEGRERESYRKMISVSQASSGQGIAGGITVNAGANSQKTRGILNPLRYIAGKYV